MTILETTQRIILRAHQGIYERTDGRVGHNLGGVPCLLLRTTGARTGATRTSALVYADDGGDLVVVASNGGGDRSPGWLHNVKATPAVEIQIGRRSVPATARVVGADDPDYPRLWKLVNAVNRDRYDAYQQKTTRPIPLVALTPSS